MDAEDFCDWPDLKSFYERIAHQIGREDGLINYRLTWFLASEGFLFTAFAVTLSKDHDQGFKELAEVATYILPSLGIIVSFLALKGVRAAERALVSLKNAWRSRAHYYLKARNIAARPEEFDEHWIFPRPYGDETAWRGGHSFNKYLPVSIGATWVLFLIHRLKIATGFTPLAATAATLFLAAIAWEKFSRYRHLKKEIVCNLCFCVLNPTCSNPRVKALIGERRLAVDLQLAELEMIQSRFSKAPWLLKGHQLALSKAKDLLESLGTLDEKDAIYGLYSIQKLFREPNNLNKLRLEFEGHHSDRMLCTQKTHRPFCGAPAAKNTPVGPRCAKHLPTRKI